MPDISLNCREEQCSACSGCEHECHAVPPPASFREVFEAARREARREDGEQ